MKNKVSTLIEKKPISNAIWTIYCSAVEWSQLSEEPLNNKNPLLKNLNHPLIKLQSSQHRHQFSHPNQHNPLPYPLLNLTNLWILQLFKNQNHNLKSIINLKFKIIKQKLNLKNLSDKLHQSVELILSVKSKKDLNLHLNQLLKKNKSNNLKNIKNQKLELKRKSKFLELYLTDQFILEKGKKLLKILTLQIKIHQTILLQMSSDH